MRNSEIEAWALRIIQRVEGQQPVEDSRVELKSAWPGEYARAARRIAGHANAARGEPILWLIGVDEATGVVGADYAEFSNWISQIQSSFDQLAPRTYDLSVPTNSGQSVVALVFETIRAPFVVRNPHFGSRADDAIALEVPWRDGTRTRSATRADLLLVLSDFELLTALHTELEWNLDIAIRTGTSQWQFRTAEFDRLSAGSGFGTLPEGLRFAIREAYVAISHAQSLVRTYENATPQGRAHLGNEMIDARLLSRPHIREALNRLQGFLGMPVMMQ